MSVDGEYRYDKILPKHWEREALAARYDPAAAVGHVRDLVARLPDHASDMLRRCRDDGLTTPALDTLASAIAKRCHALMPAYGAEAAAET